MWVCREQKGKGVVGGEGKLLQFVVGAGEVIKEVNLNLRLKASRAS